MAYITARYDQDKPTEDPTFEGFMETVHHEDRDRILGDLWQRVARDPSMSGILIYMAMDFRSRAGLDTSFLDQAEVSKPGYYWTVHFHVLLEYASGRGMTGGLALHFFSEPGKTPRYSGYSINT